MKHLRKYRIVKPDIFGNVTSIKQGYAELKDAKRYLEELGNEYLYLQVMEVGEYKLTKNGKAKKIVKY